MIGHLAVVVVVVEVPSLDVDPLSAAEKDHVLLRVPVPSHPVTFQSHPLMRH